MRRHDDLQVPPQRAALQLEHRLLLRVGMQAGIDLVDEDQCIVEPRDILRDPQDGTFSRRHVELGIPGLVAAFQLREQQVVLGPADDRQVAVAPRQDALGEGQLLGVEGRRPHLSAAEPQQAAHLGGVGEVGEGAQIDGPLGLALAVAAGEAASPPLAPLPGHGDIVAVVQVLEINLRPLRRIRGHVLLPAGEVGKQPAGRQVPGTSAGNAVGAGAREEHRGLPAAVRSCENAHRILEGNPDIPNTPQSADADRRQRFVAVSVAGAQGIPDLAQLPGHQRHGQPPCGPRA